MRAAVQAVADQSYPQAAQMAHETGQPAVTFTYLDGSVTNIALAQSSGFPLLDQAALEAARLAHYPPPPAGFSGRTYQITVSVIFQMTAAPDVDGD
jgi:protein TonB